MMTDRTSRPQPRRRYPRGPRVRLAAAAGAAAGALVLSSCGLGTAGGYVPSGTIAGPLAGVDLEGADVAVGSKNFTEQVILGTMMVILLNSAGADAEDLTNIPGSSSTRQALLEGIIDFQWEYTGTAWITYMGQTDPIPDATQQWEAVRDIDRDNGLEWLPPAELDNTYAFVLTEDRAAELGVESLADIADLDQAEVSFCVDAEFLARSDGFRPMLEAYSIPDVPDARLRILDIGAIYQAVANGECTFGEAFATDGRIPALNLATLEDPLPYFPRYNLSGVVGQQALDEHPEIATIVDELTSRLDNDTMAALNQRVDVDGQEPATVAWEWLLDEGLVTE
ncbi:MAG: glycine betaine ABC transporter substrate-binding protein [Micrococcus sp.]|nr:glycine betaine ABC transporter substrate-binding protein [Micrococcus sp.]